MGRGQLDHLAGADQKHVGIGDARKYPPREAHRAGLPAPLHTALYRLIRGKEASWTYRGKKDEAAG